MRTFSNTFVVVRTVADWDRGFSGSGNQIFYVNPIVLGVFRTHDAAQSFADAEDQRMVDKGYPKDKYKFKVELGTYYDD
jgi:hypothetical protein